MCWNACKYELRICLSKLMRNVIIDQEITIDTIYLHHFLTLIHPHAGVELFNIPCRSDGENDIAKFGAPVQPI